MYSLIILLVSVFAGFLGSLLGLGGGVIVVSVLTLFFGVDIRYAIAASLISIIATSSGAAASFLKDHLTNLRVAVFLEIGTVTGAISGFFLATYLTPKYLYFMFAFFLLFSAFMMLKKKVEHLNQIEHPWAKKLNMSTEDYKVSGVPLGLVCMYFAGILSAVLGIGSGIFKVLAMDNFMKLPIKVSSATSNFMIGVTASASAGAYLLRGDVRPEIACPVSLGIIGGSFIGAKVLPKVPAQTIRKIFVVVLVLVAWQMLTKGLHEK